MAGSKRLGRSASTVWALPRVSTVGRGVQWPSRVTTAGAPVIRLPSLRECAPLSRCLECPNPCSSGSFVRPVLNAVSTARCFGPWSLPFESSGPTLARSGCLAGHQVVLDSSNTGGGVSPGYWTGSLRADLYREALPEATWALVSMSGSYVQLCKSAASGGLVDWFSATRPADSLVWEGRSRGGGLLASRRGTRYVVRASP